MKVFKRFACRFRGHIWANDSMYPVHGWNDAPNPGSYCTRCRTEFYAKGTAKA